MALARRVSQPELFKGPHVVAQATHINPKRQRGMFLPTPTRSASEASPLFSSSSSLALRVGVDR